MNAGLGYFKWNRLTGDFIQTLLDKFITAFNNKFEGKTSSYDGLLLKMLPEKFIEEKAGRRRWF